MRRFLAIALELTFYNYRVPFQMCAICSKRCLREPYQRVPLCSGVCRVRHRYGAHLRRTYGIDLATHENIFARQNGRCPICLTDFGLYRLSEITWVIDHDHRTSQVRGFLCPACNFLLGNFRDSPAALRAAAEVDGASADTLRRAAMYLESAAIRLK